MFEPVFLATFTSVFWAALLFFFVFMPLVLLWVFAIADLFKRDDIGLQKVLWLLFILVVPIIGPVIYLLTRPDDTELPPLSPPPPAM